MSPNPPRDRPPRPPRKAPPGAESQPEKALAITVVRGDETFSFRDRLLTPLVHALDRTGGRRGLVTMCEGGGQANVTIVERP